MSLNKTDIFKTTTEKEKDDEGSLPSSKTDIFKTTTEEEEPEEEEEEEDQEEEKVEEQKELQEQEEEENTLSLQLGDVIKISAPKNEYLHDGTFLIDYIDSTKINLLEVNQLTPMKIKINDDHTLGDGTIETISLLYRNEKEGYARQHGLDSGIWINIYFGGDVPTIITGKITNVEEDMIEVTTYPEKEIIYINFAYKGIPEDLPITLFEIRKEPEKTKTTLEDEPELLERKEGSDLPSLSDDGDSHNDYEREELVHLEHAAAPSMKIKNTIREFIIGADELKFGEELESIEQYVDVDVSQQRYNIETQTGDLLDELLSTIPNTQRTSKVLNNIHVMIERFKQLRTNFSTMDLRGNITGPLVKDASWKPLFHDLRKLKSLLYWILPVAQNVKKVYNISTKEEIENSDIHPLSSAVEFQNMETIINTYKENDGPDDQNRYASMISELNPFFTPFEGIEPDQQRHAISKLLMENDLNVIIDNLDDLYSSVVEKDIVTSRRFVIQKYNMGLNRLHADQLTGSKLIAHKVQLTPPDTLYLKSIITLPEPVIRFSRVSLPGTTILDKSNLHMTFIQYWQLLKKSVNMDTVAVDNIDKELELDEETFVSTIKNYVLLETEENSRLDKDELYSKFLNAIIPKTRVLFNLIKKYIVGKLSIHEVISMMEPFLVYTDDLTFMQYKEITAFLQVKISEYNKTFLERRKQFNLIRGEKDPKIGNTSNKANTNSLTNILNPRKEHRELYESYQYDKAENTTNSEFLRRLLMRDYGVFYQSVIAMDNIHLMLPENINAIIDSEIEAFKQRQEGEDDKKCITYNIVKQYKYNDLEELSADNDKTIYVDKKFDTTPYSMLEDYEKEQIKMPPEQFKLFLIDKLQKKYTYSAEEAPFMADTIINGMKEVRDGDYAIMYMEEPDDKIQYYKRTNGRWVQDDTVDPTVSANNNTMLCNFQENCIEVAKKYQDATCESMGTNKKSLKKIALTEMIKEFDITYQKSKEQLEAELSSEVEYHLGVMEKLKELEMNKMFKYNAQQFKLGAASNAEEQVADIVISPYSKLLGVIMGQSDFVKKQSDLVKFATRFTREAIDSEEEDPHWRYCIETSVKLMPTFLYTLSGHFINDSTKYSNHVDSVIKEIGALSDDGDAWVDKHSGYIIRLIDFGIDEGYEEGYKVKTREVMEQDMGDAILSSSKEKPVTKFDSPETKMINNIITALAGFMGLHVEDQREFMIKIVMNSMPLAVPDEKLYKEKIEDMAKKGKTIPPRQTIYNLSVLFLTLGAFLIGVQVSIPSVKTRKSFPGCVKSFSGFPFDGTGDFSGLIYIACVAYKIRSSTDPWSVLQKSKEEKIVEKLKGFIETYYLIDSDVIRKFQEKAEYLLTSPNESIPNEHSLSKWSSFLPPLKPFHISDGIESISSEYTKLVIQDFRSGSRKQREKVLVIESKALLFSLGLQEKIQKIIEKKKLILTNSSNNPFLENSCCDEDRSNSTTLSYFEKEDEEIRKYNKIIESLGKVMRDIYLINRAPYLLSQENTKNIYPSINDEYNEETIYRAFIRMCKFTSAIPLNEDLLAVCSDKPSMSFALDESIHEMIRKLKQDGRNYDNTAFLRLLQVVNRKNIITYTASDEDIDITAAAIQRLRNVIDYHDSKEYKRDKGLKRKKTKNELSEEEEGENDGDSESEKRNKKIDIHLKEKLTAVLDTFDLNVDKESEDTHDLKNFLGTNILKMKATTLEFLTQYGNMNKSEAKKIEDVLNHLSRWEANDSDIKPISDNSTYNALQFMKTYMKNMGSIFPELILQGVDNESIQIPKHWGISDTHKFDIIKNVRNYYEGLRPFYEDKKLTPILLAVPQECDIFLEMASTTPYFTDIHYKETETTSIFDKRTSRLLFEYYTFSIFQTYIELTEREDMISLVGVNDKEHSSETLEDESQILMPSLNPSVLLGNKKELNTTVAKLLLAYLSIMEDHKLVANFSYDKVMDYVFRSKEREKDTFTDRLKSLTDEERNVDTIMKINKLGAWSKGLQKGITNYVKDAYDDEREEMEKIAQTEKTMRKRGDYEDVDMDDYLEEQAADEYAEGDEYDMSGMGEDYMDGDTRYGDERDPDDYEE